MERYRKRLRTPLRQFAKCVAFLTVLVVAVLTASTRAQDVPAEVGGPGRAVWFPNADACVSGALENPGFGYALTVEMWILVPSTAMVSQEYVLAELGTTWRLALNTEGLVWQVQNDEITKTHAQAQLQLDGWNHIAATYNATEMKIVVNGETVQGDLEPAFTIQSRAVSAAPSTPANGTSWASSGCKAVGGALADGEIVDCVIPFYNRGSKTNKCLPFNSSDSEDDPLYDASSIEAVEGLTLWCATVSKYRKSTSDSWGFCDCPFLANSSFAARSGLVGNTLTTLGSLGPSDTNAAEYSGEYTNTNATNTSFIVINLEGNSQVSYAEQIRQSRSTEDFVVLISANQTLPSRDIVVQMADLGAFFVLIDWFGDAAVYPAIVNDDLTCFKVQQIQEASGNSLSSKYRCAEEASARFGTDVFAGDATSLTDEEIDCSAYPFQTYDASNAFDADRNSSWIVSFTEASLSENSIGLLYTFTSEQSLADVNKYALVAPAQASVSAPKSWYLELLIADSTGIYEDWLTIDSQENVNWEDHDIRWYNLSLAQLGIEVSSRISCFRLTITDADDQFSQVGLAEFGIFASNTSSSTSSDTFYKSGLIDASSWYAPREMLSSDPLTIPVWTISARASPDADKLLTKVRESVSPTTLDYLVTINPVQQSILSATQALPDRGTLTLGRGMIGVMDNFRLWNISRTASEIEESANLSFGVNGYDLDGLVMEWTMDNIVTGASTSDVCDVPLALNAQYIISSSSSAVSTAGEVTNGALLVPSTANITGGDIVVYLPTSSNTKLDIDLTGYIPSTSSESYSISIVDQPQYGSLTQINLLSNIAKGGIITVGTLVYIRDTSPSATYDEFTYRIKNSVSKVYHEARVYVYFERPAPNSSTLFTSEGSSFAPLVLAWPEPGFSIFGLPTSSTYSSFLLPDIWTNSSNHFFVLDDINLNNNCLISNDGSEAAFAGVFLIDISSVDREENNGSVDISLEVNVTTSNAEATYSWQSLTASVDVSMNDISPTVTSPLTVQMTSTGRLQGVLLQLESSASDAIFRVQQWPAFSEVIQADSGNVLEDTTAISVRQYVATVLRFSSQYATCDSCTIYGNPLCNIGKSCQASSSWNSDQVVGEPNVYPETSDNTLGWKPRRENGGSEFLELELEEAVYISSVDIFEVFNPGAVSSIKIASTYKDSNSTCYRDDSTGQNICEELTSWTTLWSQEESVVETLSAGLKARIFGPDICPGKFASRYVRIELNTTWIPGWHVLDSVRVTGTSILSPGLITASNGTVLIRPIAGIFASDNLEFTASDCQLTSSSGLVKIEQDVPVSSVPRSTSDVFSQRPQILISRGVNRTALVNSIQFDWDFLFSDVLSRLSGTSIKTPSSLVLTMHTQNSSIVSQVTPSNASNTSVVLELSTSLEPSSISTGEVSTILIMATFQGFTYEEEIRNVTYRVKANLTLDCYQSYNDSGDSEGRCAENRELLPGECVSSYDSSKDITTRKCTCYDDASFSRLIAGEACEYTMWETCNGRGAPYLDTSTNEARCLCFNESNFGGQYCDKRAGPVASLEDLVAEVEAMGEEILALVDLDDLEVVVDEPMVMLAIPQNNTNSSETARRLIAEVDADNHAPYRYLSDSSNTTYVVLASFNLTEQMDATDTCNNHGTPTSAGDCVCSGFYEQPDCFSEAQCDPGQYIVRVQNPEWTNTSDDSVAEEIGECVDCEPGYYCDSRVRTECPAGTFAHESGMYECRDQCVNQGYYMEANESAINGIQCTICPSGTYCDGQNMTLCPTGQFSPQEGLTQCISCNKISSAMYADEVGSIACKSCPANTQRINSDGINITECVCEALYWNGLKDNPTKTGVPCYTCPDNAVCLGNTNKADDDASPPYTNVSPYPLSGFWGDPDAPSEFFACDDEDSCIGTSEFLCSNSTEGVFCFQCRDGWYSIGQCHECPGGGGTAVDAIFVIFCWGGVISAWVLINILSNEVRALDLILLYTQVVGIVQGFDLDWPSPVDLLNTPFDITGFEVDFFAPNCWWRSWNFVNRFVLQFLLPFIYAIFQACIVYLGWLHVKFVQHRNGRSKSSKEPAPGDAQSQVSSQSTAQTILDEAEMDQTIRRRCGMISAAIRRIILFFDLPDTKEDLEKLKNKSIGLTFNFCLIVYPSLVVILLEPLSCIELANGQVVMQASPDIVCWEGKHIYSLVVWSAVGIVLYIIGIPVLQFYILTIAETKDLKADPKFLERFGWMYNDFRQEVYKWECLMTFRRFAFAVVLIAAAGEGYIQAVIGCLVIVWCFALHVMYQPFLSRRLNIMDQASLFGSFLYIFFGVVFTAYGQESDELLNALASSASSNSTDSTASAFDAVTTSVLAWFLMLVTLGVIILGIVICYLDGRDYLRVVKAEAHLLVRGQTETVSLVRTVRHQAATRSVADIMSLLGHLSLAQLHRNMSPISMKSPSSGKLSKILKRSSTRGSKSENESSSSISERVVRLQSAKLSNASSTTSFPAGSQPASLKDAAANSLSLDLDSLSNFAIADRGGLDATISEKSLKSMQEMPQSGVSQDSIDLESQDGLFVAVPPQQQVVVRHSVRNYFGESPATPRSEASIHASFRDWCNTNCWPVLSSLCAPRWRSNHSPIIADPGQSNLFAAIDSDGSGTINREELQNFITNELQMDGEAYRVQLDNLFAEYDVDQTGTLDKHEFARLINENVADLRRSELKNAIKSKYLIHWVLSDQCSPLQTTLFFELDAMSRDVIKPDGPVSVYRGSTMARFYRKLIRVFPFLLDWLMVADQEDLQVLCRMLKQWQETSDFVSRRGTLSRVILPQYQAPFAFWMINRATEDDRLIFQAVMTSIISASSSRLPVYERFRGNGGRPEQAIRASVLSSNNNASEAMREKRKREQAREAAAARGIQRFYRIYKKRCALKAAIAAATQDHGARGSHVTSVTGMVDSEHDRRETMLSDSEDSDASTLHDDGDSDDQGFHDAFQNLGSYDSSGDEDDDEESLPSLL